jgi:isoquinoline 1-oxidoreductase beta subunit
MAEAAGRAVREGDATGSNGHSRRRFIGYLIAGPTLIAGAQLTTETAAAAVPTVQVVDAYDLSDLLNDAAAPTSGLITVTVNRDGTVSFALPRAEVGQGITTAIAMTIADEMGLPLSKVNISLADARPELIWNQLTGGSNTMHSMFLPVRVAAAVARGQLLDAAANLLGELPNDLTILNGLISAPSGQTATIGSLSKRAAVPKTRAVRARLKSQSQLTLVGAPQPRIDAGEIVTGAKQFAMDLDIPGAPPTMVCRPPTINGTALAVTNAAQVHAMPGINRCRDHSPHPVRGRGRGRARPDVRAVHHGDPRAQGCLGQGVGRRQVGRRCAGGLEGGRAAADAGDPAHQNDRAAVHVLLPPR